MPVSLFWVNKTADSATLSRSSKDEETRIRRHVQTKASVPELDGTSTDTEPSQKQSQPPTRLVRGVPTHLFSILDEAECRGLQYFTFRTARDWPGWQDSFFWNALVLNAAHQHVGIAHGLIALAALHESSGTPEEDERFAALRRMAYVEFSKSAAVAQRAQMSYPLALVSCIVFSCMQDVLNAHQSFQLIRSGHALLKEIDDELSPMAQQTTLGERLMIDTYIRPVFERLTTRFCTIGGLPETLKLSAQRVPESKASRTPPELPASHSSLRHSRDLLESVLMWGHDSVSVVSSCPKRFAHFKTELNRLLAAWDEAVEYVTDLSVAIDQQSKTKTLLRLACMTGRILLETYDNSTEIVFDNYMPEFRKMLSMIHDLDVLNNYKIDRVFGIDSGLIDMVALIGGRCRDPQMRRWAIRFLKQMQRIEGDRVGYFGGVVIDQIMRLEEESSGTVTCAKDVPECNRRRLVGGYKYHALGERRIVFVRSPYGISGGSELEEVTIGPDDTTRYRVIQSLHDTIDHAHPPEVYFGIGWAGFLDDKLTAKYFELSMIKFFFPIPRV